MAMAGGSSGGTVQDWVEHCRRLHYEATDDPWGENSTWEWQERLRRAADDEEWAAAAAWAVAVLGRMATDRGEASATPLECFPNGSALSAAYEIHLGRWWDRLHARRDQHIARFLEELIQSGVYRHLRVATRKLANQGVSTYKFIPERGQFIPVVTQPPGPTYTAPRVRQAFRIMTDLGLIGRDSSVMALTPQGQRMQERHRD